MTHVHTGTQEVSSLTPLIMSGRRLLWGLPAFPLSWTFTNRDVISHSHVKCEVLTTLTELSLVIQITFILLSVQLKLALEGATT